MWWHILLQSSLVWWVRSTVSPSNNTRRVAGAEDICLGRLTPLNDIDHTPLRLSSFSVAVDRPVSKQSRQVDKWEWWVVGSEVKWSGVVWRKGVEYGKERPLDPNTLTTKVKVCHGFAVLYYRFTIPEFTCQNSFHLLSVRITNMGLVDKPIWMNWHGWVLCLTCVGSFFFYIMCLVHFMAPNSTFPYTWTIMTLYIWTENKNVTSGEVADTHRHVEGVGGSDSHVMSDSSNIVNVITAAIDMRPMSGDDGYADMLLRNSVSLMRTTMHIHDRQ